MPPFLPRKRSSPPPSNQRPRTKRARLSDVLDAGATNADQGFKSQHSFSMEDGSDASSDLSEIDSDEFEHVSAAANGVGPGTDQQHLVDREKGNGQEEDDEIEWEDAAIVNNVQQPTTPVLANGSIELTFRTDDNDAVDYSAAMKGIKKGPSRREKMARFNAHQLHVQFLLWHNAIRNSWISDKVVQETLVKQLPLQILTEIEKWKRASGLQPAEQHTKGLSGGKDRKKKSRGQETKRHRDWGSTSQPMEVGKPDMSHGDPLISLMRVLAAYWKKRFAITAPGLRKRGYGTKLALKQEIQSHRNDQHDMERHGERINDLNHFRKLAESCEGSRDVGAQLFTALMRGLGLEARLVASLQPTGYGWTKAEQMVSNRLSTKVAQSTNTAREPNHDKTPLSKKGSTNKQRSNRPMKGKKILTVNLDTDGEDDQNSNDYTESVVDVTAEMPKQKPPKYDRELAFPIYWTEVVSPITNKILPVSPLVLENAVAATSESLAQFEPRGAKAEKAQQVMAYVIAHSSDGTAKEVTVRYLRKRLWPGKTKGFRFPVEKVPIYNQRGKVMRYEEFDWFKDIMSRYMRSFEKRTAADDIEDTIDLIPAQLDKKDDDGVDTLQRFKSSVDFTLERFLRREEALKPEAKPVRMFVSGKGDSIKQEPVYRRADVERCLTAESWHKEGRRPKLGETPMKLVPVRAVTLTRKREAEEHERVTGQKQMQGLYSWDQTEWIIPAPIEDGVIPKNFYGNMDCFVPSMVPKGAVHIPLKGTVKICKKLGIDFAEAVTGFEFGNKRAVPVCTGVVVALENKELVLSAWKTYNEEQKRKEDQKIEQIILDTWKKFVIGLRIRERIVEQYGDELKIDDQATGLHKHDPISIDDDDDETTTVPEAGGFCLADEDEDVGGGFLLAHEDDASDAGELVLEHEVESDAALNNDTDISANSFDSSSVNRKVNDNKAIDDSPSSKEAKMKKSSSTTNWNTTQIPGNNAKSEKQDNLTESASDNDSADNNLELETKNQESDDSDSKPEVYTPRITRRPRKATLQQVPVPHAPSSNPGTKSQRGRAVSNKFSEPAASTRKRRGQARTSQAEDPNDTTSAGRKSFRLGSAKKKHTTSLTSPYFESSD